MINVEQVIFDIEQALARDPSATMTLIDVATLQAARELLQSWLDAASAMRDE